ncbi:MAG: trigger factor [Nitrospiraceae bacterium]|nr:trigger factor [Nitrospiraceae bacterium]
MLKNIEEVSPTKKRLVIEIPPAEIEKEIGDSLARLRQRTRIPGFRAGKAPMSLIEKKFGKDVEGEVLQHLIPKHYSAVLKEADLRPIADPVFENAGEFRKNEPFNMTLVVEVFPKIENLKYAGIKVKEIETPVTDAEVDDVINRLREDKAVFEPTEAPLAEGDLAIMDYKVEGEEKSFEGQVFKIGSTSMPKEFSDGLTGKKKGDAFDLAIKFPDDYPVKEAAGKEHVFHITLKDAKKIKLPELDGEFAKDLNRESMEDLKTHVLQEIQNSKKAALKKMQKAELMRKLVEENDFPVPEGMVESEVSHLASEAASQAVSGIAAGQVEGQAGAEGKAPDMAKLKEEKRPDAVRNVKASILLETIGRKENVNVTEEDVRERVAELAKRLGVTPEYVIKYYISRHGSMDAMKHAAYEEKIMDLPLGRAEFEKVEK